MAELKFLDFDGLSKFKSLLTNYIDTADALSIKGVGLSRDGKSINFYKELPIEGAIPAYSIEFPDTSNFMELVADAIEDNIAILDSDGQVIDSGVGISDLAKTADLGSAAFKNEEDFDAAGAAEAVSETIMSYIGEIPAGYDADTIVAYVQAVADTIIANGYDDTQIKAEIAANTEAIETLNGDEDTEGSVANTVKNAIDGAVSDIDEQLEEKADKATTLEGYGIEDAYTKDETDTAIATAVANADHLKRQIVERLPNPATADENTIYMVPKIDGNGEQQYDEYMLINGVFEKIGDTAVDLTDYATKEEVSTAKEEAIEAAEAYADSLGSDYATAEQGAKADTAVQSVTTGETDGTINVDGTEVAVAGLASGAFNDIEAITDEEIESLFE